MPFSFSLISVLWIDLVLVDLISEYFSQQNQTGLVKEQRII